MSDVCLRQERPAPPVSLPPDADSIAPLSAEPDAPTLDPVKEVRFESLGLALRRIRLALSPTGEEARP